MHLAKRLAVLMLLVSLAVSVGCRRHPEHTTHLQEYAERERIPEDILDKQGDQWPQFLYDYSISHGPNFTKKEMREFTSWRVK
jgi:hypothetical protein